MIRVFLTVRLAKALANRQTCLLVEMCLDGADFDEDLAKHRDKVNAFARSGQIVAYEKSHHPEMRHYFPGSKFFWRRGGQWGFLRV